MKYLAIIQARCGSTRLPNKVLNDLCGKPQIMHVVERVRKSKYVDEVVVATSINKENLQLIKLLSENNVRVFVGSEDDVLDRFYQCAKLFEPKYVIRVTADCPVYDSDILDMAIEKMQDEYDYLYDENETLADGLDIEIIKSSALKKSWQEASLLSEREHLTQYIRKNKKMFKICNYVSPYPNIESKRWTVDEKEDYEFITKIYNHFNEIGMLEFGTKDILDYIALNPEIEEINARFIRNEGLAKSLKNDQKIKIDF